MTDYDFIKLYNAYPDKSVLIMGRGASYDLLPNFKKQHAPLFYDSIRIGINHASLDNGDFSPQVNINVSMDCAAHVQGALNICKGDMLKDDDMRHWYVIPQTPAWFFQYSLTTAFTLATYLGSRLIILAGVDKNSSYSLTFNAKDAIDLPEKTICFNKMYEDFEKQCRERGIVLKHISEYV